MQEETNKLLITDKIRRIAEIEDELNSRGIKELRDEQETLKKQVKAELLNKEQTRVFDEVSGYEAVIQSRKEDSWDVDKFKSVLTNSQTARYIVEWPDFKAIEEGLANGDLSRAKLESSGAVEKVAKTVALYIRKVQDE